MCRHWKHTGTSQLRAGPQQKPTLSTSSLMADYCSFHGGCLVNNAIHTAAIVLLYTSFFPYDALLEEDLSEGTGL